jgi:hypothetical protein
MKSFTIFIILLIAFATAMYFLGKKNGTTELKATIINNQQMVQQIAELSVLEVSGTTTTKLTNVDDKNGFWDGVKNYFAENTLLVTIPYHAKYGVDMSKGKVTINKIDTVVVLFFPPVKLLSFQLELDKMETMNETGLFNRTTIADMKRAQQTLYTTANQQLVNNTTLLAKAREHVNDIFVEYYRPLGYKVQCNFSKP